MNINTQLPAWAWWLMGLGLALFAALVALSVRRNRGVKRTLFAAPYSLWMILFTVLPVILIGYYAFTDQSGAFTLDNFRNFWDSNYTKNQLYASLGPEAAQYMVRGTVTWTPWSTPCGWPSCAPSFAWCWGTRRRCSWPTGK